MSLAAMRDGLSIVGGFAGCMVAAVVSCAVADATPDWLFYLALVAVATAACVRLARWDWGA